jgi:hypothetical protein
VRRTHAAPRWFAGGEKHAARAVSLWCRVARSREKYTVSQALSYPLPTGQISACPDRSSWSQIATLETDAPRGPQRVFPNGLLAGWAFSNGLFATLLPRGCHDGRLWEGIARVAAGRRGTNSRDRTACNHSGIHRKAASRLGFSGMVVRRFESRWGRYFWPAISRGLLSGSKLGSKALKAPVENECSPQQCRSVAERGREDCQEWSWRGSSSASLGSKCAGIWRADARGHAADI